MFFYMDIKFMYRAIELAKRGEGFTNPNPLVGAVIVKNGRIIGEGYHKCYGDLHAERNAINSATESVVGADMYVTLEPCSHYGKQPPCTEAIVAAGIKNIFIGSADPNPLVSGKGVLYLKNHGINVVCDVLKQECDAINEIFFHYITTNMPYIILKAAMTLDGKTSTCIGDSNWITNEKSRENVHLTRKRVSAIMVGIYTVLADDPMLDCRTENPKTPIRVICDSTLKIPLTSNIAKTADKIPTIVATVSDDDKKIAELKEIGVQIIKTSGEKVNLKELLKELEKRKIDSILVEGGATLHASLLKDGLYNKVQIYIAPKILGGTGKSVIGGEGVLYVKDAYELENPVVSAFGSDILLEYDKRNEV